ncbi:MAG: hypothetical protein FD174_1254 [Geobacteraceae bacterium]|nr:MAG: hypothetical protein FD174_1254 [Geobacteraceae bacterium]
MFTKRHAILCSVFAVCMFTGCVTTPFPQLVEAEKKQAAAMNIASYEQIRPAIEKIQAGDTRDKVLGIVKPKKDEGNYISITQRGVVTGIYIYHNWPGVLTTFDRAGYFEPEKLREIHLGYLEGQMLRPRKIIIFEKDKVSQILDVPDPLALALEPGVTIKKLDWLSFMRKEAYTGLFLPKKDRIVRGMHRWELFILLGANYMMSTDWQSFTIMCPGFLNYSRSEFSKETQEGIRTVYPFGYLDGDREVIEWEVELLNFRVTDVRPYRDETKNKFH